MQLVSSRGGPEAVKYLIGPPAALLDVVIELLLVVVVVSERRVDLGEGQVRVLPLDLLGVPVVRDPLQRNLDDLRRRTGEVGDAVGVELDMSVCRDAHLDDSDLIIPFRNLRCGGAERDDRGNRSRPRAALIPTMFGATLPGARTDLLEPRTTVPDLVDNPAPPASPGARRQLKTRDAGWAKAVAAWLAKQGVSPNAISVASVVFATVAGGCYAGTLLWPQPWVETLLFLLAAGGIQLRLLCNLLDGMVAVEWGKGSRAGEIYNDLPDRIADTVILCAAGYAAAGRYGPTLGWAAAVAALLTAYLRVLGRSVGAGTYFIGPMK